MASRRTLKKTIDYVVGDILTECIVCYNYIPGVDAEKVLAVMNEVTRIDSEFIKRISHTEPGQAKMYYRELRKEFGEKISAAIEKMADMKKK
ncbi:MAG: hypothetical protein MJY79_00420 [Bacteroidaceae bacterium]|nr:hypothetical protein [Bacteroidaceae bacterium]